MPKLTVCAKEIALEALRCPEDRQHVIDSLLGHGNEGLNLLVERRGTKTWYRRARVNGSQPRDLPLGRWPDVSLSEARIRKADAVSAIGKGEAPWQKRAEGKRRRCGITLDQVFQQWIEEVGHEKRSIAQDRLRYEMNIKGGYRFTRGRLNGRTLKAGIGHLPIPDIKRFDISNCLVEVRRRSASQAHPPIIHLPSRPRTSRRHLDR